MQSYIAKAENFFKDSKLNSRCEAMLLTINLPDNIFNLVRAISTDEEFESPDVLLKRLKLFYKNVGAYGKQSDGKVFRKALYIELMNHAIDLPALCNHPN
ncbi:unnamed protein product [Gordionus sp. m RMFG-2023]